jgi:hypothetical protein
MYILAFSAICLNGCRGRIAEEVTVVKSQDQAASVLMTPSAVIPWAEISSVLAPNFNMNGEAALPKVLSITERINEQILDANTFSLGLGFAQTSEASKKTETVNAPEGNAATDSSTVTRTKTPGVAPTLSSTPPSGLALPTNPSTPTPFEFNSKLKYKAANYLNQSIQILNFESRSFAQRRCYIPYVVNFKLAIMPYRSRLPYAVHTRAAFFKSRPDADAANSHSQPTQEGKDPQDECSSNTQALPLVVPLLAADDVQVASRARAAEAARQINIALSGLVNNAGINVGGSNLSQEVQSIQNQELSSTITITRQAENTLYIMISPENTSSGRPALIGQVYDVAVLLLIPRGYFSDSKMDSNGGTILALNTYTEFRNVLDGTILPARPPETTVKQLDLVLTPYLRRDKQTALAWSKLSSDEKLSMAQVLSATIQEADFIEFKKVLEQPLPHSDIPLGRIIGNYDRTFWTALSALSADSQFKTALLEFPAPKGVLFSKNQAMLLLDDGKEFGTVSISSINGASYANLTSRIEIGNGSSKAARGRPLVLQANFASYDAASGITTFRFPSPSRWVSSAAALTDSENKLVLSQSGCDVATALCPSLAGAKNGEVAFPLQIRVASDANPGKQKK